MKLENNISELRLYRASAFVAEGCEGNPAGVCLLPSARDERFYKDIAVKMGCSETAFVFKKDGVYRLRWFTRAASEVDLCGHATLALSWILWKKGYVSPDAPINYDTRSGILTARLKNEDIFMDFPVKPVVPLHKDEYPLGEILGVGVTFMGKAWFDLLAEVDDEDDVKKLRPDFAALKTVPVRGIIVTARSRHDEYDFVSRFFAPSIGIDEDPVTGSAHCALGSYWGAILKKDKLTGYQASREGGVVRVEVLAGRVLLGGKVRKLRVPAGLKYEISSLK